MNHANQEARDLAEADKRLAAENRELLQNALTKQLHRRELLEKVQFLRKLVTGYKNILSTKQDAIVLKEAELGIDCLDLSELAKRATNKTDLEDENLPPPPTSPEANSFLRTHGALAREGVQATSPDSMDLGSESSVVAPLRPVDFSRDHSLHGLRGRFESPMPSPSPQLMDLVIDANIASPHGTPSLDAELLDNTAAGMETGSRFAFRTGRPVGEERVQLSVYTMTNWLNESMPPSLISVVGRMTHAQFLAFLAQEVNAINGPSARVLTANTIRIFNHDVQRSPLTEVPTTNRVIWVCSSEGGEMTCVRGLHGRRS